MTWFGRTMDQDWVDLANGFWSVLLLAVCSLGAFLARYVTKPISCWTPAQFTRSHVQYAENTCFMKEDYYLPFQNAIPSRHVRHTKDLSTHLWIPLVLFLQAVCFMIPRIIWKLCRSSLAINMAETVTSLEKAKTKSDQGKSVFTAAAKVISSLLQRNGFLLASAYLLVKVLYCFNLLGQFIFLTLYFGKAVSVKAGYSIDVGMDVKPLLMKKLLCDFSIAHVIDGKVTNKHQYTVQCSLPISDVYEKLFVFLWYWVFFLAVITFLNLLLWAGFLFLPFLRDSRISAHISAFSPTTPDISTLRRFISSFLGIDGVFMLSMISRNSSELVTADLTHKMYQVFQARQTPVAVKPEACQPEEGAIAMETFSNPNVDPVCEKPPLED